jgi:hypothetical protein
MTTVAMTRAAIVSVAGAVVGVAVGLQDHGGGDVDQQLHEHTIEHMRAGVGYYDAMRLALVEKAGHPPANVWTVRPPLPFELWQLVPTTTLRLVVGGVFFALLLGIALIARDGQPNDSWLPAAAVALAIPSIVNWSSFLYLHTELWTVPLALFGVAMLRRRPMLAAALLGTAIACREMWIPLFVLAALWGVRAGKQAVWPWLVAGGLGALALGLHVVWSQRILDPSGTDAAYLFTWDAFPRVLTPGTSAFAVVVGLTCIVVGGGEAIASRRAGAAAWVTTWFAALTIPLTFWSGRVYWQILWAPFIIAFVPAGALHLWRRLHPA